MSEATRSLARLIREDRNCTDVPLLGFRHIIKLSSLLIEHINSPSVECAGCQVTRSGSALPKRNLVLHRRPVALMEHV